MDIIKEKTEVLARFAITDLDCDPDLITKQLKVMPTKVWRVGDDRAKAGSGLTFDNCGWRIESELDRFRPVTDHVNHLISRMQPGWDFLRSVSDKYCIELALAITMHAGDQPELHFDPAILGKLAEVKAHIDIDLYY